MFRSPISFFALTFVSFTLIASCSSGSSDGGTDAAVDAETDAAADDIAAPDVDAEPDAEAETTEPDTGANDGTRVSEGPLDRTGLSVTALDEETPCGIPATVDDAPLMRLPFLQSVFPTSARVAWASTVDGIATVRYSVQGSDEWREVEASARYFASSYTGYLEDYLAYDATLPNLPAETFVCYEVWLDGMPLFAGGRFETAITSHDRPISIIALGDSGTGSAEQYRVRDQMAAIDADVFLHLGDMAYGDGTFFQFELFMFQVYGPMMHRLAMWPTIGNHEYNTNFGQPYIDVYHLPEMALLTEDQEYYYSFDYGNIHFVSVDSNDRRLLLSIGDEGDDMVDWLEADLAASEAEWKIVFMHHPPFSSSARDVNRLVRSTLLPTFERHGVDLVLAGHDHHYERTFPILDEEIAEGNDAITYIVSGAGGAGLRFAYGDWFTANMYHARHSFVHLVIDGCIARGTAIDLTGEPLDVFEVNGCDD